MSVMLDVLGHYSLSLSNMRFLYGWVTAQGQICAVFFYKYQYER